MINMIKDLVKSSFELNLVLSSGVTREEIGDDVLDAFSTRYAELTLGGGVTIGALELLLESPEAIAFRNVLNDAMAKRIEEYPEAAQEVVQGSDVIKEIKAKISLGMSAEAIELIESEFEEDKLYTIQEVVDKCKIIDNNKIMTRIKARDIYYKILTGGKDYSIS